MREKPQLPQTVRNWLAEIGRRGGLASAHSPSEAKVAASRENGKKGGRPPKKGKKQ
jgi:general stress protein YciG